MVARLALAALVTLLAVASADAQLIRFFGDERVGTSGGQFLRVPVGARGIAMGQGMSASASGAHAMFWNPASMSTNRRGPIIGFSHTEYAADIDVDHASYVHLTGAWQIGLGLGMLRSGEIERTTEFMPNGTGETFEANQFLATLGLGRKLTDRFAFALNAKLLQENLDDYENRGVFIDLGALYNIGFRTARIGFAVRNFGGDLQLNGDPPAQADTRQPWQSFPAPTVAVFGFAYDFLLPRGTELTTTLDFDHPSDGTERLIFGGELDLKGGLFLRGGYRNQTEFGGRYSAGFGIELFNKRGQRPMRLDYAFDDRGSFGGLHTVSVELGR